MILNLLVNQVQTIKTVPVDSRLNISFIGDLSIDSKHIDKDTMHKIKEVINSVNSFNFSNSFCFSQLTNFLKIENAKTLIRSVYVKLNSPVS